jgi:hypothetical protein
MAQDLLSVTECTHSLVDVLRLAVAECADRQREISDEAWRELEAKGPERPRVGMWAGVAMERSHIAIDTVRGWVGSL